jgi:hypothetical protein
VELKTPFQTFLNFTQLAFGIAAIRKLPKTMAEMYKHVVTRYCGVLPQAIGKFSPALVAATRRCLSDLKAAILRGDVERTLWLYKELLMEIDRVSAVARGHIPITPFPSEEQVAQVIEYFNKAEDVAFAFINM